VTEVCECCGQVVPPGWFLRRLTARCQQLGISVAFDGTVDSKGAARLLNISEQRLRTDRCYLQKIPFTKRAGRVRYALVDLLPYVRDL
jgi:hypothetical protein